MRITSFLLFSLAIFLPAAVLAKTEISELRSVFSASDAQKLFEKLDVETLHPSKTLNSKTLSLHGLEVQIFQDSATEKNSYRGWATVKIPQLPNSDKLAAKVITKAGNAGALHAQAQFFPNTHPEDYAKLLKALEPFAEDIVIDVGTVYAFDSADHQFSLRCLLNSRAIDNCFANVNLPATP